MDRARLFLIEFNELCPSLLQRFMGEGILPNFRRFFEASTIYTTDAQEEPPNLEPWIQWPTVHSGLPFAEHGVFHLGDGQRMPDPCVAELLSDAGVRVGVCASMNLNYRRLNGYYLPDPWDQAGVPDPAWLGPFYHVIARQVQESSRDGGCTRMDMLRFGLFLLHQGLTAGTATRIIGQLMRERWSPGLRWRRACLLDRLLYDVFRNLNRRFAVQFASFFCNSTAHFQHYYWRNMEPEQFAVSVPESDHPSLRYAIPHGYRMMDRLIGRFLHDYPDAVLLLCTALSQQPWTDTTKCTYRPHRFEDLLDFAGIAATMYQVKPVMAEEFHIECTDEDTARKAEARLRELAVDGEPLMKVERQGRNLFAGCRITAAGALDRQVTRPGAARRFGELFYMVHTMRSGRHHPDGVFWVRNGRHQIVSEKVPLTAVAPSILKHFGIEPPARMRGEPLPLLARFAPPSQSASVAVRRPT
jgi:hypothetical protein